MTDIILNDYNKNHLKIDDVIKLKINDMIDIKYYNGIFYPFFTFFIFIMGMSSSYLLKHYLSAK